MKQVKTQQIPQVLVVASAEAVALRLSPQTLVAPKKLLLVP
jgi:hypothetical protein